VTKRRLVLACLTTTDVVARARAEFDAIIAEGPADMTVPEITRAAVDHRAQAIIFTNTLPLDAAAITELPDSVRAGATISVGYDHIDVTAARGRGLMVTNTPGVLDECTADHAMMLLLTAARRGVEYDRIMRQGWRYRIGQVIFWGCVSPGNGSAFWGWGGSAARSPSARGVST
jgi:lactate dehydrogenase-like 2-hydroxyacid dehydrogenase